MIFDEKVSKQDRERILRAIRDIEKFGTLFHQTTAKFFVETDVTVFVGLAKKVGGSGSVQLLDHRNAHSMVENHKLSVKEAAKLVRLNIARETIDTGGQQGIEGTLVHEGKHARDFALMLSTFSRRPEVSVFNPTAYQRELSAHLTSAFYLRLRGGNYVKEGESLGLLKSTENGVCVDINGINRRLKSSYSLSAESPGRRLNSAANPKIGE